MSIRRIHQMAYFTPAAYEQAWEHDLLEATNYRDHADYRREVEQQLQAVSADGRGPMRLVTLDVPGLAAEAETGVYAEAESCRRFGDAADPLDSCPGVVPEPDEDIAW